MINKPSLDNHTLSIYLKSNVNTNLSVVVEMLPDDVLFQIVKDVSANGDIK